VSQLQSSVSSNTQVIAQNTAQILNNTSRLSLAETNIGNNALGIADNATRITNVENALASQFDEFNKANSGVAIALALPDAYLGNHENFAVAGGVGHFGNETGVAVNLIARGDYGWSFGAGIGTSGGEVGTKVQARWAK